MINFYSIYVGIELPGDGSIESLRSHVEMTDPANLTQFLAGFQFTSPALAGDLSAIERLGREFCEDAAFNGLLYVESRKTCVESKFVLKSMSLIDQMN